MGDVQAQIKTWEVKGRSRDEIFFIVINHQAQTQVEDFEYVVLLKAICDTFGLDPDECICLERQANLHFMNDEIYHINWDASGLVFLQEYPLEKFLKIFPEHGIPLL